MMPTYSFRPPGQKQIIPKIQIPKPQSPIASQDMIQFTPTEKIQIGSTTLWDFEGSGSEFKYIYDVKLSKTEKIICDNLWIAYRQRNQGHMVAAIGALSQYLTIQKGEEVYYCLFTGPKAGIYATWPELLKAKEGCNSPSFKKFNSLKLAMRAIKDICGTNFKISQNLKTKIQETSTSTSSIVEDEIDIQNCSSCKMAEISLHQLQQENEDLRREIHSLRADKAYSEDSPKESKESYAAQIFKVPTINKMKTLGKIPHKEKESSTIEQKIDQIIQLQRDMIDKIEDMTKMVPQDVSQKITEIIQEELIPFLINQQEDNHEME